MFKVKFVGEMMDSSDDGYKEIENKSSFSDREEDLFSKSEWKKIDSKIKSLDPFSDWSGNKDYRISSHVKNHYMVYEWNFIGEIYRIEKYEDEWYYVEVNYHQSKPFSLPMEFPAGSRLGTIYRKLYTKRYECDQFGALLKLIEDTIKIAIPLPNKDS